MPYNIRTTSFLTLLSVIEGAAAQCINATSIAKSDTSAANTNIGVYAAIVGAVVYSFLLVKCFCNSKHLDYGTDEVQPYRGRDFEILHRAAVVSTQSPLPGDLEEGAYSSGSVTARIGLVPEITVIDGEKTKSGPLPGVPDSGAS